MNYSGARLTFGCSWRNIQNKCKFCRSSKVHKFKLVDKTVEGDLVSICEELTITVLDYTDKKVSFITLNLF